MSPDESNPMPQSELDLTADPNRHWSSIGIESTDVAETWAMKAVETSQVVAMDLVESDWEDGSKEKHCMVFALDPEAEVSILGTVASEVNAEDFELIGMAPVVHGDFGYGFEVTAISEEHNGTNALYFGKIHDQDVVFYNTMHLASRGMVEIGDEIGVSIAGVAYSVAKIDDDAVLEVDDPATIRALDVDQADVEKDEDLEPIEVPLAGTVSLVHMGDADYELLTIIQEVDEISVLGQDFYKLTVGFFATEDFDEDEFDDLELEGEPEDEEPEADDEGDEVDGEDEDEVEEMVVPLTLFVLKANCEDDYVPAAGDTIEVGLWLNGNVLEDEEDEEEGEEEESEGENLGRVNA